MTIDDPHNPDMRTGWGVALLMAALKFALHLPAIPQYGIFRDELYYLACSRALAWGYVDQPPFSIAVLAVLRTTLGSSLWALRLLPALCGAGMVFFICLIVRRMGGGRFAQVLAALCAILAPVNLVHDHYYSMNSIEGLIWTVAAYVLVRIAQNGNTAWWLGLGVLGGIGLLNKISMAWFMIGTFIGIAVGPQRRVLATRGPWLAALIAGAMFAPHVVWQVQHGWPTLEFMRNATTFKLAAISPADFLVQQALLMNPATLLIWNVGLLSLLFAPVLRPWRMLGVLYLVTLAIVLSTGSSRPSYLAPAYPALFAAGAFALERFFAARRWRWAPAAATVLLVLIGAPIVPFGLPLLPVDQFIDYSEVLGITPRATERNAAAELPQHFADQFGWEEIAARVAAVYDSLPPADRERCAIYGQNYGEAGAIDYFASKYGLPRAVSGHNNYWLWGTRDYSGDVMIIMGGGRASKEEFFEQVDLADSVRCTHCMPYERDLPIWVCRGLKQPLSTIWPRLRQYI